MSIFSIRRIHHLLVRAGAMLILPGVLLAAGCAVVPETAQPTLPLSAATCSDDVEMGGRFSVRYVQDGREEALHGSFAWRQQGALTAISLMSPLGQTMAVIEVAPLGATLTEAGKPPRTAQDADALAAAELGWPLPVAGLREWLRGCATDSSGRRFFASPGNESVTTRDGWRIRYVSWQEDAGATAPRRIDFERGEVALRLVIDSRRLNNP